MTQDPSLETAYALETPEDSVRLYGSWADSYDSDFVETNDYILHEEVARHFVLLGGFGPVLDVGAGTGICGIALRKRGIEPLDGTDISPQMLERASQKGIYRTLFTADLLKGLPTPKRLYQGAVSSGTFTHGHVGPDGIDPILSVLRPGAWVVISVNSEHFKASRFDEKLSALDERLAELTLIDVPIYGANATGPHAKDRATLIAFRKA